MTGGAVGVRGGGEVTRESVRSGDSLAYTAGVAESDLVISEISRASDRVDEVVRHGHAGGTALVPDYATSRGVIQARAKRNGSCAGNILEARAAETIVLELKASTVGDAGAAAEIVRARAKAAEFAQKEGPLEQHIAGALEFGATTSRHVASSLIEELAAEIQNASRQQVGVGRGGGDYGGGVESDVSDAAGAAEADGLGTCKGRVVEEDAVGGTGHGVGAPVEAIAPVISARSTVPSLGRAGSSNSECGRQGEHSATMR